MVSGKFVLRAGTDLHGRLQQRAKDLGLSLNELCKRALELGLQGLGGESGKLDEVCAQIKSQFGDHCLGVVLFGSHARGDAHDSSDIDLLVVVDRTILLRRQIYREYDMIDSVSVHFSHLPQTPEEAGSLWLECALDGRVILDSQTRVARMLSSIKAHITSGNVVRMTTHGQGYWVHQ